MEFRNVRIKDIEKVRELEVSLIREYFAATLENKWEDLPQDWKDGLGASSPRHFKAYLDSGLSFVAEEDGEIVGFIFAQMLHHICDVDNLLWVENMGVHPYFRRNEIGYRLLRECVLKGREMGAAVVHSSIQPDNAPSILLHKKMGFFIDRRDVALLDLNDPGLRLRRGGAPVGDSADAGRGRAKNLNETGPKCRIPGCLAIASDTVHFRPSEIYGFSCCSNASFRKAESFRPVPGPLYISKSFRSY